MKTLNRKIKPDSAAEVDYKFPSIEHFKISNGINIYLLERTELPIVRIITQCDCGSSYDPLEKKGLARLVTKCLDEGAGEFDSLQLEEEFDILGTQFSIDSDDDSITLNLLTLSENIDRSIYLLSLILQSPHLKEENFNREKRKTLTQLLQIKDNAEYIANRVFYKMVFGQESFYSHPSLGYDYTVKNISVEDIKDFYNHNFFPDTTSIIIVGDISKIKLTTHLEKYFSSWRSIYKDIRRIYSEKRITQKYFFVDKKEASQTEIRIGHSTGLFNYSGYFKKMILNTAFGGQFSSRLNSNLRERNGYTYGISSSNTYLKHSGKISIGTSVATEITRKAVDEIFNEIEKIRKGLTADEFAFAKSYLIKKYPLDYETNSSIAGRISSKLILNFPDDHFENYLQRLNDVDLNDVNSSASDFINPKNCIVVLVGDKAAIKKQFNDKELIELDYNGFEIH